MGEHRNIELTYYPNKELAIIRWLQILQAHQGENASPVFICAIEYYIITGKYMNIGTVKTSNMQEKSSVRKRLYVPDNSPVLSWADNIIANCKKGTLTLRIKQILLSSIEETEDSENEFIQNYEYCEEKISNFSSSGLQREYGYTTPVNNTPIMQPPPQRNKAINKSTMDESLMTKLLPDLSYLPDD